MDRAQDAEARNQAFFDVFWNSNVLVYETNPTSRHRRRFILRCLKRCAPRQPGFRIFDYGVGTGATLGAIQTTFSLEDSQFAGCDIAPRSLDIVEKRFPGGAFFLGAYPKLDHMPSVVVCSEVIEHTTEYRTILSWIYNNLMLDGVLILTTQAKPMHAPDEIYGHVQHFDLSELRECLEHIGFTVEYAKRWGFPFFTLQKAITKRFYDRIEQSVISSPLTCWKRAMFRVLYIVYMIHDIIPSGPQIFIRARRP